MLFLYLIMMSITHNKFYRYFILLAFTTALSFTAKAQDVQKSDGKKPGSIVFIEGSFKDALKQAAIQNKYIFVDAYASWCGPCKLLKATTFRNKKAADFYNDNFVNVSIDMEKGDGPMLAEAWGIQAYPTLIVFDAKGKPVLGTAGYMSASDLIRFGKQALSKTNY